MSLNQYTQAQRVNRFAGGKAKHDNTTYCANQIRQFLRDNPDIELEWPYHVRFDWYWKNKRTDEDNIAFAKKFIFDGFQEAQVLSNDNWSNILGFEDHFHVDPDNPRVEVTLIK